MNGFAVVRAASQPTAFEAAVLYVTACGFSVAPVQGKRPTVDWARYQTVAPSVTDLRFWHRHGLIPGVAIITGQVSGGLVILDLDGPEAAHVYARQWPHLLETYIVKSANGYHLYYWHDGAPLPTTRVHGEGKLPFKEIGLRSDGAYTVAPPSLHPSGTHYGVHRPREILRVDMFPVKQWILSLIAQKTPPKPPAARPAAHVPTFVETGRNPYWERWMIRRVASDVSSAPPGARNDTLNRAAFLLGGILGNPASSLTRGEVEIALEQAAARLAADDGIGTVRRTIRSGLDAGMLRPVPIPVPKYHAR